MSKLLIVGNSGSGKSTLARRLAEQHSLAHLDLDTLAWKAVSPPQREEHSIAKSKIDDFTDSHSFWVIEGCYTDLLRLVEGATQLIYLDLPTHTCIANAQSRPWEPHKFESKAAQDANLEMLLNWIQDYDVRTDTFSKRQHDEFFHCFAGEKSRVTTNQEASQLNLTRS